MDLSNKKVVVIGGAGFIGSHLVDKLVPTGARVVVFDNFATGKKENIIDLVRSGKVALHRGDMRCLESVEKVLEGADFVFHLATHCVRLSLTQPAVNHEINATGTLNTLLAAQKKKVQRYIYCSSSEVYGNAVPSLEKGLVKLSENSPKVPTTVYGASKLVGEHYTLAFHQTHGVPSMVVRPFNTYGPRAHVAGPYGEVIPRFAVLLKANKQPVIFGSGSQTRDFTYVEDTANALIQAAQCDALLGSSINIARGQEVSILELTETLCKILQKKCAPKFLDARPGEIHRLAADTGKAEKVLALKKWTDIEKGLTRYIQWLDKKVPNYLDLASTLSEFNWLTAG